jgi:SAM-dependent MidA family methyltransferase
LEYWFIEPSANRQKFQRQRVEKFAGLLRWALSPDHLPDGGIRGVIFSNELLDAFPVHRLRWDARSRRWFEWGVTWEVDQFVWAKMENPSGSWDDVLAESGLHLPGELSAVLPDGFTIDLCPKAGAWWKSAAGKLARGRLLTFDYGLTADQFFAPERSGGTLRAYHKHALAADLLANPGEQDLTAHVNFTQLQRAGENAGLNTEGLVSQARFLTQIFERAWNGQKTFADWSAAKVGQFQTLTHPEHLGRSFRVLTQSR